MTTNTDIVFLDRYDQFALIFGRQANRRELDAISLIRIRLDSLHYAVVGREWGTVDNRRTSHYHHIHFAVSGGARVFHGDGTLELAPGGVYWLPANCPVATECLETYEHFFLALQIEWAHGVELFIKNRAPACLGQWDPNDFVDEWHKRPLTLNACWRLQAFVQELLADALADLDAIVSEQQSYQIHFAGIFKYIEEHLDAHCQVADLARIHGISSKAFSRAFTANFGISPRKYLNNRLNQRALDLVVGTDLRMSQVADALGFSDEYYFNRFFSKMNGLSPLKYRKRFTV